MGSYTISEVKFWLTQLADAGFSMARPCLGRPANREHAKAAVSFMIVVGVFK